MNENVDLDIKIYKIIYTQDFREELVNIYNYIANVLKEKEISNKFIRKILIRISELEIFPRLYMKIRRFDRLNNEYHRMVVNNYIILYTIDDLNQKVFISHIYYKRRNYL